MRAAQDAALASAACLVAPSAAVSTACVPACGRRALVAPPVTGAPPPVERRPPARRGGGGTRAGLRHPGADRALAPRRGRDRGDHLIMNVAQTNLQLYNQLLRHGLPRDRLVVVHRAYELLTRLYAGYYQGDGKPFVAHGVGVASILDTLDQPAEFVALGLVH